MDEQGFDFQKAPERREPKRFEPPPWEREAFEAIQGERAQEQSVTEAPQPEPPVADEDPEVSGTLGQEPDGTDAEGPTKKAQGKTEPDEAQVIEMLARLAAEETEENRASSKAAFGVSLSVSIVTGALGMMLLMWGMAALVKTGQAGLGGVAMAGAWTMVFFGAGFLGLAVWLLYRMLKQRGVL